MSAIRVPMGGSAKGPRYTGGHVVSLCFTRMLTIPYGAVVTQTLPIGLAARRSLGIG